MAYDRYGNGQIRYTDAERKADMARLQAKDDERARNSAAWARLCGMMSPIGGPTER